MSNKNWTEKETNQSRIKRWRMTARDAFGTFTSVPNQKPIESRLLFYGGPNHTDFDNKEKHE